jgi:hypothetical protein
MRTSYSCEHSHKNKREVLITAFANSNNSTQVEFRRCMRRAELDASLRVRVVEQEVVVTGTAELLNPYAPFGRVAVPCIGVEALCLYGAVADGKVALAG